LDFAAEMFPVRYDLVSYTGIALSRISGFGMSVFIMSLTENRKLIYTLNVTFSWP
jgi:hypothetical protein